jgi:hypothetical protein
MKTPLEKRPCYACNNLKGKTSISVYAHCPRSVMLPPTSSTWVQNKYGDGIHGRYDKTTHKLGNCVSIFILRPSTARLPKLLLFPCFGNGLGYIIALWKKSVLQTLRGLRWSLPRQSPRAAEVVTSCKISQALFVLSLFFSLESTTEGREFIFVLCLPCKVTSW